MKNLNQFILRLAIPVLLVLTGFGSVQARAAAPEPGYRGRPLTWWLNWWSTNREGAWTSADGPPFRKADLSQCAPALSQMGTSAVPLIIARLRQKDNPVLYYSQAAAYFGDIGSNAIPHLTDALGDADDGVRRAVVTAWVPYAGNVLSVTETSRIFGRTLDDTDDEVVAKSLEALERIGPAASNCVPAIIRVLKISVTDSNKSDMWKWEVTALGAATLAQVGPPASNAIPVLKEVLHSSPPADELGAAVAIWRIGADTNTALPVLLKWCERGWLQSYEALGEIGPAAKDAVPLLLPRAKSSEPLTQRTAAAALKKIDPDAAVRAGL